MAPLVRDHVCDLLHSCKLSFLTGYKNKDATHTGGGGGGGHTASFDLPLFFFSMSL